MTGKLKTYGAEIEYTYCVYPIKVLARSPKEAEALLVKAMDEGAIKEEDWSVGTEGPKLIKFKPWMEDKGHVEDLITVTREGVVRGEEKLSILYKEE